MKFARFDHEVLKVRKASNTEGVMPLKRRRDQGPAIEEITFDFTDRETYLTGFHKRKVQRTKLAKEVAAKKEREEKITARKLLREERRVNLQRHVEAVNEAVRKQANLDSDEDGEGRPPITENSGDSAGSWSGLEDPAENVNHEDEYEDDEKYTMVTVEAVDFSKEGLSKAGNDHIEGAEDTPSTVQTGRKAQTREREKTVFKVKKRSDPKHKKKKFKYESKAERQKSHLKEKMGNRVRAKQRRG